MTQTGVLRHINMLAGDLLASLIRTEILRLTRESLQTLVELERTRRLAELSVHWTDTTHIAHTDPKPDIIIGEQS